MNTLIIYDNTGYIIDINSGQPSPREPQGIPFIWSIIPEGKRLVAGIGVDVTVTPNIAILENIPKTIEAINTERITSTEDAINAIMLML